MENYGYGSVIGSSSAPYVNSLLPSSAFATNYYGVSHPSLPNYLALTGGSTYGISSDCTTCWVSARNLADNLEATGSSWKAYMESMPSPCFIGDSYPYAQKHNPFIYFNDIRTNTSRCQAHVVPYTQLATDLGSTSTTPNYAFITPNMCNDMHDCGVAAGDRWLQSQVPQILSSPAFRVQRSLLVLTWDEDDIGAGNHVPTILLGGGIGVGARSAVAYNHYSLLHTIESARGVSTLTTNDAGSPAITDLFSQTVPTATPCAGASVTASPLSPMPATTQVTFKASSTNCPNPRYEFWALPPGSNAWQVLQSYSASTTFTWNTNGLAGGSYLYTVWARDAASSGTTCSYLGCNDSFVPALTYRLTTGACTSVTDAVSALSPQASGTSITFTASSSGCANPRYQFWILPPGGSWQIAKAYSSGNTFIWNTTGLAPGSYMYTAWARDAASTGTQCSFLGCNDAFFAAKTFSLTRQTCASVNDTPSLSSPQLSGSGITFTAGSTGCANPRYQFWIRPPGGNWQVVRSYSATNTYAWNTSGLAPGNYLYTAWVRDASSTGTQCSSFGCNDAFFVAQTFRLTTQPCTSVSDIPSPASTQASGTTITFTAGSTGCPRPLYQFWIRSPGGTWQIARAYASSNTFSWTTALPAGSYLYTAWVRDASSLGTQCGSLGCNDAYFVALPYGLT